MNAGPHVEMSAVSARSGPTCSEKSGLSDADLQHIVTAAQALPNIHKLVLFGSRAKGNYKPGSDVDLSIDCTNAGYETAVRLASQLNEETTMPYFFDVVDYRSIAEPALIDHIDRVGIVLLQRQT